MQVQNVNNQISFKGVIFKNKSLYARYGNGIVGKIRQNPVVESFKYNKDYDMFFSAVSLDDSANFYWQVKKKNITGPVSFIKNLFAPKVLFESTRLANKPSAELITAERVGIYIAEYLL